MRAARGLPVRLLRVAPAHPVGPAGRRRRARRAHRGDLRRLAGHLRLAPGAPGAAARGRARAPRSGSLGSCAARAWSGRCRRRWTKTTISDPDVAAVDLLKRAFGPGTVELDRVYVGDITYIWTWEGWAYLATVIDLASRRVVGWAMADHMRAELVCDALRMAIAHRRPAPGLMFHSDRGTQYTSTRVHRPARRARDDPVAVTAPAVLGQRGGRELLRLAEARTASTGAPGPPAPRPAAPCSTTSRCSSTGDGCTPRSATSRQPTTRAKIHHAQGRSRGIVNLSGEPGQPHKEELRRRRSSEPCRSRSRHRLRQPGAPAARFCSSTPRDRSDRRPRNYPTAGAGVGGCGRSGGATRGISGDRRPDSGCTVRAARRSGPHAADGAQR